MPTSKQEALKEIAHIFRGLAERFKHFSERAEKPDHLDTNLEEVGIQSGRLMVRAIDAGAFPKDRSYANKGWWDRSRGRIPGAILPLYGCIPNWAVTAFERNGVDGVVRKYTGTPAPDAEERILRDSVGDFTPQQCYLLWICSISFWLGREFRHRFRERAAKYNWWQAATTEDGEFIGSDGKPLTYRWFKDDEILPEEFVPTQEFLCQPGWSRRLMNGMAGATDRYDYQDWLEHNRRRAESSEDACLLLAEQIEKHARHLTPSELPEDLKTAMEQMPARFRRPFTSWCEAKSHCTARATLDDL